MEWLKRLFGWKSSKKEKRSQDELFFELVERHNLYGKVALHWQAPGGQTLYFIDNKELKNPEIPVVFLEELAYLLRHGKIKKIKNRSEFSISALPKTAERIESEEKAWHGHCVLANVASD